jgi:F-type H+-transporting ATPase subunit delta
MPTESSETARPETVFDIKAQQVGAVYARALLGATEKAGQTESVLAELDAVVSEVLDAHPQFDAILTSGVILAEEKVALIDRTLAGRISPLLLNFLRVLAQHGRLDCLRAARQQAWEQLDQLRGRVKVRVATAKELPEELFDELTVALRAGLGGEPVVAQQVKEDLIGGLVLQVGDTVFDGSVSAQLQRVRNEMIQRSVHEIQSRRDRLRFASGD